jgi:hypothetical protein
MPDWSGFVYPDDKGASAQGYTNAADFIIRIGKICTANKPGWSENYPPNVDREKVSDLDGGKMAVGAAWCTIGRK